jgi:hypothetical protein
MNPDSELEVIKTFMPLIPTIGKELIGPDLLYRWKYRNVHRCYNSLLSHLNKRCLSLGTGTLFSTDRENRFEKEADIESLIKNVQDTQSSTEAQHWVLTHRYQFKTAFNAARAKIGLESGKFYYIRHFRGKNHSELMAVLTVNGNTAEIQVYNRGPWKFPKKRNMPRWLHRLKLKFIGYVPPDHSIMLE